MLLLIACAKPFKFSVARSTGVASGECRIEEEKCNSYLSDKNFLVTGYYSLNSPSIGAYTLIGSAKIKNKKDRGESKMIMTLVFYNDDAAVYEEKISLSENMGENIRFVRDFRSDLPIERFRWSWVVW